MLNLLWRLLHEEEAATAVEYAVMLALIIGAIITAIGSVGTQTGGMWGNIQASVNAVGFGS
ncbi:MAG: Flp family type IVb pilin [Pirellulales bacterium]